MTPPPEILGGMKRLPLIGPILAHNGRRRVLFAVLVAVCAVLSFFPERYRVASTLTPSDPATLGLQSTLGQTGAFNTVFGNQAAMFGNQAAIEIALRVARSTAVRDKVADKLDLDRKLGTGNRIATSRWLDREVNVRSLRGGIIQVELTTDDVELAGPIVGAYAEGTREQLAKVALRQTEYKRSVLEKLVTDSTDRMLKAQASYDRFRLNRRTAEPGQEIEAISGRIEGLRQAIKGKNLQLRSELEFATPDNFQIRQIESQRRALQAELSQALAQRGNSQETLGNVVVAGTELLFLERELAIARSLFDNYNRYLLGTYVEDLTSTANIRILEPPYVDTARQYNFIPLGLGVLLLLIGIAFEMQMLRRPVGPT
jgi:hypothetical protein